MKYIKGILIWLTIVPLAILNGGMRIYVTEPLFGSNIAQPLSGIVLSALIFIVAYFLIPKIGRGKPIEYVVIGAIWFVLTNLFDLTLTILEGKPISDFFGMFDITTGNLWCLVIIVCLVSPLLVAKIRKLLH